MYHAAEGEPARSTGVAESSVAREHGLSTAFDEEVDKLAKDKAALRNGLADIRA